MSKTILNKVQDILTDNVYNVSHELSTDISNNENGILDVNTVDKAKRAFLMETVGVWKDELVYTKQGYPKGDISNVTFGIDCVVMKKKEFNLLIQLYEQLSEEGQANIPTKA